MCEAEVHRQPPLRFTRGSERNKGNLSKHELQVRRVIVYKVGCLDKSTSRSPRLVFVVLNHIGGREGFLLLAWSRPPSVGLRVSELQLLPPLLAVASLGKARMSSRGTSDMAIYYLRFPDRNMDFARLIRRDHLREVVRVKLCYAMEKEGFVSAFPFTPPRAPILCNTKLFFPREGY